MKENRFELSGNQIIIIGQKSPLIIRVSLVIVLFICVLIPIAATIFIISEAKGPHIGLAFSFLFFWGIGFYLLRIILWNSYGKEILNFETETFFYEADYRLFRDAKKSISKKSLEVEILESPDEDDLGTLLLIGEKENIETVLKLPLLQLEHIVVEVESRIQKI